jgi:hypothetical protein
MCKWCSGKSASECVSGEEVKDESGGSKLNVVSLFSLVILGIIPG